MSKSTISTFELFQMFPDQESARVYFEARRWPDGATCPACGEAERIGTRKGGFYHRQPPPAHRALSSSLLNAWLSSLFPSKGAGGMTERIKQILDAVTDKVMAYRPADKGQQAKKVARRVKRQRKKAEKDDD